MLSVVVALMLITTAAGVGVQTGMVDTEEVSPVGQSEAVVPVAPAIVVGIAVGTAAYNAYTSDASVNTTKLAQQDALETKTSIYQSASTQKQNNDILKTSFGNYVQDTESIARMEAKSAYIRALENGSSEAVARTKAIGAVEDYYATKQIQLARSFETAARLSGNLRSQANQSANVSADFVSLTYDNQQRWSGYDVDVFNASVSLVNGSSVDTARVGESPDNSLSVNNGGFSASGDSATQRALGVKPPSSNYNKTILLDASGYASLWSEIESQQSNVQSEVDTFINNTYSAYEKGQINSSDLVDPYLEARDYSPEEDHEAWAIRSLTAAGVAPPDNASMFEAMTVQDHASGETVEGLLMSDGLPSGGGFEVGKTYNADTLTGLQYVVKQDTQHELSGNFTVKNATRPDGSAYNGTIGYSDVDYQTTNISEFKQRMDDLQKTMAEIEARQTELRGGGSGGPILGGDSSKAIGLVVIVGVIALYLREQEKGGDGGRRP